MRVPASRIAIVAPSAASAPALPLPAPGARDLFDLFEKTSGIQKPPLTTRWQHTRVVAVGDGEVKSSVDALLAYHAAVGFYGERIAGMQRLTLPDSTIEIQLAPNRNKAPLGRQNNGDADCVLCNPPQKEERGLLWRNWVIWPNAYPYVPLAGKHILLASHKHQGQGVDTDVLSNMIDYQKLAGNVTMHYNGIAGNSQFHRHWHATCERLPLQRLLDDGALRLAPIVQGQRGEVATFEQGFYSGVLVRGSKRFVLNEANTLLAKLNLDPTTLGAYNLLLLPSAGEEVRLVVVPRRADNLRPVLAGHGRVGFGAFSSGGVLVMRKLPQDIAVAELPSVFTRLAQATIVPPSKLAWLRPQEQQRPRVA